MTPQDLVKKTILAQANKSNTDFVEVFHRGLSRKAKVEYGDFRQVQKDNLDGKQVEDSISFLDMITPFITRGDGIVYDGVTYTVEYFIKTFDGVYKVFAKKTTRLNSSKSMRARP